MFIFFLAGCGEIKPLPSGEARDAGGGASTDARVDGADSADARDAGNTGTDVEVERDAGVDAADGVDTYEDVGNAVDARDAGNTGTDVEIERDAGVDAADGADAYNDIGDAGGAGEAGMDAADGADAYKDIEDAGGAGEVETDAADGADAHEDAADSTPEGGEPVCTPAPEECDGRDNDCDGRTDEDLGETTCGLGICENTVQNCVNGAAQLCEPLAGDDVEICDGVDDNCDGATDDICSNMTGGCMVMTCEDMNFGECAGLLIADYGGAPDPVTVAVSIRHFQNGERLPDDGIRMSDFSEMAGRVGVILPCVEEDQMLIPIIGGGMTLTLDFRFGDENIWLLSRGAQDIGVFTASLSAGDYLAGLTVDWPLPPEEKQCSRVYNNVIPCGD